MKRKLLHYIFFLLLFFGGNNFSEAQYSVDFSLARKFRETSVDSLSVREKIALILLPATTTASGNSTSEEGTFQNPLVTSGSMLNVIDGFFGEHQVFPFPDIRAIRSADDKQMKQILRVDLLSHLYHSQKKFVLADHQYLFHEVNYSWGKSTLSHFPFALWVIAGNSGEGIAIPAMQMPDRLLERSQALEYISNPNHRGVFSSWKGEGHSELPTSFEKAVSQGVFFLSENPMKDIEKLARAYENKLLVEEELDQGCNKILEVLQQVRCDFFPADSVPESIAHLARRQVLEQGIRFFHRKEGPFLPARLSNVKVGLISDVGEKATQAFLRMAENHFPIQDEEDTSLDYVLWLTEEKEINDSLFRTRVSEIRRAFPDVHIALVMANSGHYFKAHSLPDGVEALFTATSDQLPVWDLLAQAVAGGLNLGNTRPHEEWLANVKHFSRAVPATRLKFGIPEEVAMSRDSLFRVDSVMAEAIKMEATPGAQVLIARDGVVVWNKNYGHHTYEKKQKVVSDHLYDVASVTKITATIPALMSMYERGMWQLEDTLGMYFPEADTTEKSGITMKELLLHESGLTSYIPFYQQTIDRERLKGGLFGRRYSWLYNIKLDDYIYLNRTVHYRKDIFQKKRDDLFSIPVARNFFMNRQYLDSMKLQVLESPMRRRHRYLYSDLGFFFLGQMVDRLSGKTMDLFMDSAFYKPLGMTRTAFLPAGRFPDKEIVPTEQDKAFRKQLIHGWVHDPGAAMMGGVAGHAGLFSNALDMARMMQMYLNKGTYGGMRYLEESTIELFTGCHNEENRRGLGFDKPEPDTAKVSPASEFASLSSFGHSGFTGTLVWADPESGLVYVFLSNRIYPHQYNKTLIKENIRTRIQDAAYKAIIKRDDEGLQY
ncbi:serine hydrolase [Marinilabilia salmonicolor]|uniref:CubicO group peptidase (Beta-lactamase class C family) n=1 Tax=Marinilabilia salmonicolor TaxID=989 RepID=A0A368VEK2_9BACT|nr:serine hydrolase [Marinilabilia salmonicolor]RCW38700.1 CubicO group peptidase (beta-lactamase class C family) [Marinilabilia salmonicolor]